MAGRKTPGPRARAYHILAERAKEIAGKKKLETKSFVIELRVDGTLEKGELRVQHSWEDSSSNKTGVLARPKSRCRFRNPNLNDRPRYRPARIFRARTPKPADYVAPQRIGAADAAECKHRSGRTDHFRRAGRNDECPKRAAELYRLEIWLNGVRQNVVPIFQNEIAVGRGSKSKPVDIALKGDPEISRRHLTIIADGTAATGSVNEGRNAAAINNYELPPGQRVSLAPGISLSICSYVLRIQPK